MPFSSSSAKTAQYITHFTVGDIDSDKLSSGNMTSTLSQPVSAKSVLESIPIRSSSYSPNSTSVSYPSSTPAPASIPSPITQRFSSTRPTTPRKNSISSSAASSAISSSTQDSQKKYRFDAAPKLVRTPWESDRKNVFSRTFNHSAASSSSLASSFSMYSSLLDRPNTRGDKTPLPATVFKSIPAEIYDCIARKVEQALWSDEAGTCVSCYLADMNSLASVSRAWHARVRGRIYQKIYFSCDWHDLASCFVRIKKLRRTLRDQPQLAALVKEINVFGVQQLYRNIPSKEREVLLSALASLIMACPNLEHFKGFYVNFDHEYDRYNHALSTRSKLKERVWILRGIEQSWDVKGNLRTNQRPMLSDGSIDNGDVFLSSHSRWANLETLLLFGNAHGNLDYRAFVGTFRALPALRHLLIANFSAAQFNDRTLAALPHSLHSLRLQDLPGLTERALNRCFTGSATPSSNSLPERMEAPGANDLLPPSSSFVAQLRTLALINTPLHSAQVLARILQTAPHLTALTVVQSSAPHIDPSHPAAARPLYASPSLQRLHWDVAPLTGASIAQWAASIRGSLSMSSLSSPSSTASGKPKRLSALPALRWLRVPCDDGTLQALCRPRSSIARPEDKDTLARESSSTAVSLKTSLAAARVAAQERLERARLEPLMAVVVTNESGIVLSNHFIRGYLGKVGSLIEYVLEGELLDMGEVMRGSIVMNASGSVCEGRQIISSSSRNGVLKGAGALVKSKSHVKRMKMKILDNNEYFT